MVYRKGELNSGRIDSEWPHQVALPASFVQGRQFMILHRFCNGLSVCPRHQYFRRDGQEFVVYCFKELSDAELFQMPFDGELMTPQTRPPKFPKVPPRSADHGR
jgi:hypothetical protein